MGTATISPPQTGDDIHDAAQSLADDPNAQIEVEAGEYHYTDDVVIPDHTTLEGADEDRVLLIPDGQYMVRGERPVHDVTVEGFTVDNQDNGEWALRFETAHDFTARNITVKRAGVRPFNASERNAGGLSARVNSDGTAGNITIDNVTAVKCAAVSIDCGGRTEGEAQNVVIRESAVINPNPSNNFTHGMSIESCGDSKVVDSYADGVEDFGAFIPINANAARRSRVEGNVLVRSNGAIHGFNGMSHSEIVDNTIIECVHGILHAAGGVGNEAKDNTFWKVGPEPAIWGKNGCAMDAIDNRFEDVTQAVALSDYNEAPEISDNRVYPGPDHTKPFDVTLNIGVKNQEIALAKVKGNYVGVDAGYIRVRPKGHIHGNTVLGAWGDGPGASIDARHADTIVDGNVTWGEIAGGTQGTNFTGIARTS